MSKYGFTLISLNQSLKCTVSITYMPGFLCIPRPIYSLMLPFLDLLVPKLITSFKYIGLKFHSSNWAMALLLCVCVYIYIYIYRNYFDLWHILICGAWNKIGRMGQMILIPLFSAFVICWSVQVLSLPFLFSFALFFFFSFFWLVICWIIG